VTLCRRYFTCRRCAQHTHLLDERLGVDGFVSPHAQRLLCLLGAEHSFERSARLLRAVAGLCVCDNTVRRLCDEHGGRMRTWQREALDAARPFHRATGDVEFQTDGTCVNTTGGRREVRLSIFAKRPRGVPVTDLDAWDDQRLPEPTARIATAAIRSSATLGPQWRKAAARLGIARTAELTALADGAKWIWTELGKNLPGAVGVLDFYHASEHVHAAAVSQGGDAKAIQAWYTARRRTLLGSGAAGLLAESNEPGAAAAALGEYLGPHVDHTPYRRRLAEGRRSAAEWWKGRARRRSASG
jgi:hypothetical protein